MVTHEELAFLAHISRNYVRLIELNQESPIADVLLLVCRAIGVSVSSVIASVERQTSRYAGQLATNGRPVRSGYAVRILSPSPRPAAA